MDIESPRNIVICPPLAAAVPKRPAGLGRPAARFAVFAVVLAGCFSAPLYGLVRYALGSELYSHVLLMPFITGYLIWVKRTTGLQDYRTTGPRDHGTTDDGLRTDNSELETRNSKLSLLFAAAGLAVLGCYWVLRWRGWQPVRNDFLAATMLSFLLLLVAGGFAFFGGRRIRAVAFPVAMLSFMVPFPSFVKSGIESFFQHTSAAAAALFFQLVPTPVLHDGLLFHLPGMVIQVAEECSGIRSSLVLFITSLLAGYLFLRAPWKRALLTVAVIPLAIARNGFRIFAIGMLCVHVDPNMINSPLHRRGGPVFFLLSLIPFFGLLLWLRRGEASETLKR